MCAVLLTVILICAIGGSFAVDVAICSNASQSKMTMTPYNDGVVGRYLVELCSDINPEATSWTLSLTFYDNDYSCRHPPKMGIHRPGRAHSTYKQTIIVDGNCSHICLNTTFDLVFSACYAIESFFLVDGHSRDINYTYFNIKNDYTNKTFMHNKALVDIVNHDEENLTIVWHTGVPFDDYDMTVCKVLNDTGDTLESGAGCVELGAAACAARSSLEVRCGAALADGCYELLLTLRAAWIHGTFRDQGLARHLYCKHRPLAAGGAARGDGRAWLWWAAAGAAAAGAAGGGALLAAAARSRHTRKLHHAVLKDWILQRREAAAPALAPRAPRHVVLLYAREGPAAAPLAAALRVLLTHAADTQVHDIFSPAVTAAAAAAPGDWLRAMLARDDTAVVLLQTPALAALYQGHARGAGDNLRLAEPLLGRRVMYRAPQYGDTLLQLAVRLTTEAAHAQSHYHKYYLATLSALPTETFPSLVPYRRYVLPGAGAALARDVLGAPPPAAALARLAAAAEQFAARAAARPDYLMDELMLI